METPIKSAPVDESRSGGPQIGRRPQNIAANKDLKGRENYWDPNGSSVKCTIHNISKTGAKLEAHGLVVKNTFELIFDFDRSRRPCRVVWRKEPMIGVKFL